MARERDPLAQTLRGIASPGDVTRIADDLPSYPAPPEPPAPFPEIEYVTERGGPDRLSGSWSAIAIWTQRRIYALDSSLVCRAVLDRSSLLPVTDHPVIGLVLAFGQRRDAAGTIVQVTRPLPEPGFNAVFSHQEGQNYRWSETSPVAKVVLRQQRVDLTPG